MDKRKKCIIFVRVSTERQSLDEQTKRLVLMAESAGYPDGFRYEIAYKESGIRLSEDARLGLIEMKELIEQDPLIDCVFAFEISRIARSKKVLFSVEEYLIEHKIQLIIQEPSIRLLNPDGTVNDSAEFAFTLYAQLAESEMRLKKERFRNGRERAKRLGNWHGGRVLLGFRTEDKKVVPDESKVHIIRRCFEMYRDGQSQQYIAQYLAEFGVVRKGHNISKMLSNERYVEIVGRELFDAAQAAKEGRPHPSKYRLYSPGERLLRCACCGRHYVHITNCYLCLGRTKAYKDCEHGFSLPDKLVDELLMKFSKYTYASRIAVQHEDDERRIRKTLDELPQKIESQNRMRRRLETKRLRVIEVYTDGKIERDECDRRLRTVDRDMRRCDDETSALIRQQASLKVSLENILSGSRVVDATLDTFATATKREIYELVHQEVDSVDVYRLGVFRYLKFNMKAGFSNLVRMRGRGRSFKCELEVDGRWINTSEPLIGV